MIKKLQRNFILIAMSSIFAVLVVLIGALNVASYLNLIEKADVVLDVLAENDARFPKMEKSIDGENDMAGRALWKEEFSGEEALQEPPTNEEIARRDMRALMSVETPYETRFFAVRLDENGTVHTVDTGKIAAINTEAAISYAQDIYEAGDERGFMDVYRYRMVKKETEYMIIFVDRSREIASFHILMQASVFLSVIGMLAVFCLVYIFSKRVFRPVEVSYQKQKQFITDASHELKTPITIISANVELLELEGQENAWTQSIQHQVQRLTSLTEQMVMLSRMDEESGEKDFARFSLSEAVSDAAEAFVPLAKAVGKELELQIEAVLFLEGDEKQIRQMVSLLLDNAVKYSDEKGRIVLSLKKKGKKHQLVVQNTVKEISTGNLDILFERFFRLDSSRNSKTGGSGIGLSIVKAIVERHGGKVNAKSEDGKSLRIDILL